MAQEQDSQPKHPAGLSEGAELPNEHGVEVVVNDYDKDGRLIGWHKELKKGKK